MHSNNISLLISLMVGVIAVLGVTALLATITSWFWKMIAMIASFLMGIAEIVLVIGVIALLV